MTLVAGDPVEDVEHRSNDHIWALGVEEVPSILQHSMLALRHGADEGSVCRKLDLVEGVHLFIGPLRRGVDLHTGQNYDTDIAQRRPAGDFLSDASPLPHFTT